MRGKLTNISFTREGNSLLTIEVAGDLSETYEALKEADLDIEMKKHRERRSLSANAYFHLLCDKIAQAQKLGQEETKINLVTEYGTLARDENGGLIGFKLPAETEVGKIYKYTRCFDIREEQGKQFKCYLVYKQTHEMTTEEMARLIDGTIYEAEQLGIETETPEELAKLKSIWQEAEQKGKHNGI